MRKFDSHVQELEYKVLREVARHTWAGNDAFSMFNQIAKEVVRKDQIPMRCCIYKDRAIVAERIRIALGGDRTNPNVVEVIDIACDDCPQAGHVVTDMCRGCIAHQCEGACHFGAIEYDEHLKAHINKSKCRECGQCAKVCPYHAIMNYQRPCEKACKADAIHMAEGCEAEIDHDKCTACGSCVRQCPFGAPVDKSYITDVIGMLKESEAGTGPAVHAIVAPAVVTQFQEASAGQVAAALRQMGFADVTEVALGADMVAYEEAEEVKNAGDVMTTSCCPAFVSYIEINFPDVADKISRTLSPMAMLGRYLKKKYPGDKVVFIGPCVAKKTEIKREPAAGYVDQVLTFTELQAMIDARDIDLVSLPEEGFRDASGYGRRFARGGGVAEAVAEALKEQGYEKDLKVISCAGLDKCRGVLAVADKGRSPYDLIEGMACEGGCIGGAGCLTHDNTGERKVNLSGKEAAHQTITDAIRGR